MFNLSVRNKFIIGFSVGLLLLIGVGTLTYLTFRRQAVDSDWVSHTYQTVGDLENIRITVQRMQVAQRDRRINPDNHYASSDYTHARQELVPVMTHLKGLIVDNLAQTQRLSRVNELLDDLYLFWGKPEHGTHSMAVLAEESKRLKAVQSLLFQMTDIEKILLINREKERQLSLTQASVTIFVGMGLTLAIAILLIYLVLNELTQRQKAQKELKQRLRELSQANQASERQNQLLAGASRINNALQGQHSIEELGTDIIRELLNLLQIPAGVFYVAEEERLIKKGAIGLTQGDSVSWAFGEGLVGRAAVRKDLLVVSDVPAGYWKLRSGAGEALPGQAAFLPLLIDKEVIGLLELVSFGPFRDEQLDLLRAVSHNISLALETAAAQEINTRLLARVREHQAALERQQETLQQTNEELIRQAEVLQASEEELKVQEEELRQVNAELEERNEAMESARQALIAKARELEVTSKYKSEFLANMSHELRTPLNSVLILARMLADNRTGNLTEKQIEHAKVIFKSGNDLLDLINDILDLSKIEAGKIELQIERISTRTLVTDMEELFAVVGDEKGIEFRTVIESGSPAMLSTDYHRVEQILKNLLSNAFKFTPKGGTISLTVSPEEDRIRLAVRDTGIGIPPEKQRIIFDAFRQADGSTNRKFGGTGLGLAISRELAILLGGEIRLESAEGEGSTFSLLLPTSAEEVVVVEEEPVLKTREPQPEPAPAGDGKRTLLIIEDDPVFAGVLKDLTELRGYQAIVALDGEKGLEYARLYKPVAMLLDIQLPGISGWDVLKVLKKDPDLKHIPVHIISGSDEPRNSLNGAVTFLKKPVSQQALDEAFRLIGEDSPLPMKKVLVLVGDYLRDSSLKNWLAERDLEIQLRYVSTFQQLAEALPGDTYDCILIDEGSDAEYVAAGLEELRSALASRPVPVILFLNHDLTPNDEIQLKKVTDVIIRNSQLAKDRLLDEMELFLFKIENKPATPLPQADMPQKDLKGKKVLVVDDDMRNVFALSTLLEEQEMEVVTAGDGREALDLLSANPDTDIILMDIMMPEMDGYEAMRHIRSDVRHFQLPIIALTAKAMQGDREKCIEAGASDYITKPVDSRQLFSLMRVWLSQV